jgi:hypothetical protein
MAGLLERLKAALADRYQIAARDGAQRYSAG